MRTLGLIAIASVLALSACTSTENKLAEAYVAASLSNIPSKTVYVAANAFNVAKASATGYIEYCTPNPSPVGCNDEVIMDKIIPTIEKGTKARNTAIAFIKEHPGGLGDKGVYDALVLSTSTLKTLVAQNDKRS